MARLPSRSWTVWSPKQEHSMLEELAVLLDDRHDNGSRVGTGACADVRRAFSQRHRTPPRYPGRLKHEASTIAVNPEAHE
jgi:hypothetical protein